MPKAYMMSLASTVINLFKLAGPYLLALAFAGFGINGLLLTLTGALLVSTAATLQAATACHGRVDLFGLHSSKGTDVSSDRTRCTNSVNCGSWTLSALRCATVL